MDLNTLHPKALAAAMKGGTDGWGHVASAVEHVRFSQPVRPSSRRLCHCGCKRRATHMGMANGIGLTTGCELAIARWVKTGRMTPNVALSGARADADEASRPERVRSNAGLGGC